MSDPTPKKRSLSKESSNTPIDKDSGYKTGSGPWPTPKSERQSVASTEEGAKPPLSTTKQGSKPRPDSAAFRSKKGSRQLAPRRSRSGTLVEGLEFYANAPANLQYLLADELTEMGASAVKVAGAGVRFNGPLETAYRACLWSRVANRILMPINTTPVTTPESLYDAISAIDWSEHLDETQTLAVDFFCAQSDITHSQYGALKVKDAVVDQFREKNGVRPSVDRGTPDVRINVYLHKNKARISIDLSGSSLHRRGYRSEDVKAPIKENIAAALLLSANWPELARHGKPFFDPMCGSATFLVEAAMMASDMAPGLHRRYFGFLNWKQHDKTAWEKITEEAHARATAGRENLPAITGSDVDKLAISAARENVENAGFEGLIEIRQTDLIHTKSNAPLVTDFAQGLVLFNPPYGKRLDDDKTGALFGDIGKALKKQFPGWTAGMIIPRDGFAHRLRLDMKSALEVSNGGIDCKLILGTIEGTTRDLEIQHSEPENNPMFANRLAKNFKTLRKWARKNEVQAYRVYDADMPEYAVAIDIYHCSNNASAATDKLHVVLQEYQAPANVDKAKAASRLQTVLRDVPTVLGCQPENVFLKVRKRQRGTNQYEREGAGTKELTTFEAGVQLRVNLNDYLDTGLFLDHRKVRTYIQQNSKGKAFLNLFAYTGAASVHALAGGASSTLSVDLSARYLEWARRNLEQNHADHTQHKTLKTDVLDWLSQPIIDEKYDLILLDPPTFSNSTSMDSDWDVQRDHVSAIKQTLSLLASDGLLIFSTNFRRFQLDENALTDFDLEDRTHWSIDTDFQRNPKIHQCWFLRHKQA